VICFPFLATRKHWRTQVLGAWVLESHCMGSGPDSTTDPYVTLGKSPSLSKPLWSLQSEGGKYLHWLTALNMLLFYFITITLAIGVTHKEQVQKEYLDIFLSNLWKRAICLYTHTHTHTHKAITFRNVITSLFWAKYLPPFGPLESVLFYTVPSQIFEDSCHVLLNLLLFS